MNISEVLLSKLNQGSVNQILDNQCRKINYFVQQNGVVRVKTICARDRAACPLSSSGSYPSRRSAARPLGVNRFKWRQRKTL